MIAEKRPKGNYMADQGGISKLMSIAMFFRKQVIFNIMYSLALY